MQKEEKEGTYKILKGGRKMKLKFLVNVPDKYTRELYQKDQVKEFEEKRAREILTARRRNGEPYAILIEEIETATKKKNVETAIKNTKKKSK